MSYSVIPACYRKFGSTPVYNETYSLGVVRRVRRNSGEVGIGVNWGDPPGSSLGSQTTGGLSAAIVEGYSHNA